MLPYLLLLVAVLLLWWFVKRHRARQAEAAAEDEGISETARRRSPFHAVSVRVGRNACLAAKKIEGQRFLAVEAPPLPLSECSNSADCECRFIHHEDRRSGHDRRAPFTAGAVGSGTGRMLKERRQGSDRRRSDRQDASNE